MKFLSKILFFFIKKYYLNNLVSNSKVHLGKGVKFGDIHYFEINPNIKQIRIEDDVKFYSQVNLTAGKDASISVGANTTINKYTSIVALEEISIGHDCLIGENVKIYDNNHRVDMVEGIQFPNHKEFSTAKVCIGNHVWIASNVTILKGVTIGDNAVVGAGCIVFKDVPENTVIVNQQNLVTRKRSE